PLKRLANPGSTAGAACCNASDRIHADIRQSLMVAPCLCRDPAVAYVVDVDIPDHFTGQCSDSVLAVPRYASILVTSSGFAEETSRSSCGSASRSYSSNELPVFSRNAFQRPILTAC